MVRPKVSPQPPSSEPWHHFTAQEAAERLGADLGQGLDPAEAAARRGAHGPNALTPRPGRGPLLRFLLQFHQPLVYLLLAAGAVTAVLGEGIDASVILGVVLLNAAAGFVQESKAARALEALARTLTPEATVVRGGEPRRVPATELVPGNLVLLQTGDRVPADLRLARCPDFQADESALTGESVPVEKGVDPVAADTGLADRRCLVYASALVTRGTGRGIVVATGDATEVGRISRLLAETGELQTPLTRRIAAMSRVLLSAILGLATATSPWAWPGASRPGTSSWRRWPWPWARSPRACPRQ